jgi:hypothetical protein
VVLRAFSSGKRRGASGQWKNIESGSFQLPLAAHLAAKRFPATKDAVSLPARMRRGKTDAE